MSLNPFDLSVIAQEYHAKPATPSYFHCFIDGPLAGRRILAQTVGAKEREISGCKYVEYERRTEDKGSGSVWQWYKLDGSEKVEVLVLNFLDGLLKGTQHRVVVRDSGMCVPPTLSPWGAHMPYVLIRTQNLDGMLVADYEERSDFLMDRFSGGDLPDF